MILGASEIFKLINEKGTIKNIDDYDFEIEGTTVDLRLDEVYLVDRSSEIDLFVESRRTAKIKKVESEEDVQGRELFVLEPGCIYLVNTIEEVDTPKNIYIDVKPRTTLFRSCLMLLASGVNPGYKGKLTFGLANFMGTPVLIERGFRICQLVFHEIKGDCALYKGNWQGGKITSNGEFDPAR